MDGAVSICSMRPIRRIGLCHGGSGLPRAKRFPLRRPYLAREFWHHRKGPAHRDRSALRFPFRARIYLLARLVAATPIELVDVDPALDLSRARVAGERPAPSILFLFGGGCGAVF